MASSKNFLSLAILSLAVISVTGRCFDQLSCTSCVKDSSWLGSCVWCPLSRSCHNPVSLLNKCKFFHNIREPEMCRNQEILIEDYSPTMAYKMAMMSAVAYSDNVPVYVNKSLPELKFQKTIQVTKDCSMSSKSSIWCSGFTTVSHIDKMVVVAFRGSVNSAQVLQEILHSILKPVQHFPIGGMVEEYFNDAFYRVWEELHHSVYNLIKEFPSYKVLVTGHSLGGALASLASATIVHDGAASSERTVLYTFGQPRVGDYTYSSKHDELVKSSWRVVHYGDIVVHLPPCKELLFGLTGCLAHPANPYHHGTEIFYEEKMRRDSPYKKCEGFPRNEDMSCSNRLCKKLKCLSTADHKEYFGVEIGEWWKDV